MDQNGLRNIGQKDTDKSMDSGKMNVVSSQRKKIGIKDGKKEVLDM